MPNNLSTLLLIGVLLFLIYCLMKQPTQATNNVKVSKDKFEDVTEPTEDDDSVKNSSSEPDDNGNFYNEGFENNESGSEYESEQEIEPFENQRKSPKSKVVGVSESNSVQPAKYDDNTAAPEISPEMINQLVSETERKSVPLNSPLLQQKKSEQVHQFEPSDTQAHSGASLDNAFERPVADNTDTDVVDLKKNNVKNYNAKDYLPKEINDDWFNTDFSQAKYKMNDDKLINTDKYIIGINTVGQSLKNASYDIRGAVNVPKYTVSPWNNSTIEPDYNIKPLC
jgi:hypothetical protein